MYFFRCRPLHRSKRARAVCASLVGVGLWVAASSAFADAIPSAQKGLGTRNVFVIEGQTASPFFDGVNTPFLGLETINTTTRDPTSGAATTTNTTSVFFDVRFHYFVIDRMSIGLEFAFSSDLSSSQDVGGVRTDLSKTTMWGALPMFGVQMPLANGWSFWPKAGIGIQHVSMSASNATNAASSNIDWYFVDADVSLVFEPIEHFALAVGPGASVHLTGRLQTTDAKLQPATYDYHQYEFRWLTAHFIAWW